MSQDTRDAGPQAFPSTHWTRLIGGAGSDPDADRAAFELLARRYFRPIAAYVRARGARDEDEAREATQEFFLWMLEGDFLARLDPSRGRFRGFVKRCLVNFLHDRRRSTGGIRRGGGQRFVALDGDEPLELPDPGERTPEQLLDDMWRRELLARAADETERELVAAGRGVVFAVFRDYFLGNEELDYAAVAQRHGISKTDVSNHLARAKQRYRAHLRSAVLETVGGDEDLRAELAWLFEEHAP